MEGRSGDESPRILSLRIQKGHGKTGDERRAQKRWFGSTQAGLGTGQCMSGSAHFSHENGTPSMSWGGSPDIPTVSQVGPRSTPRLRLPSLEYTDPGGAHLHLHMVHRSRDQSSPVKIHPRGGHLVSTNARWISIQGMINPWIPLSSSKSSLFSKRRPHKSQGTGQQCDSSTEI